MPNILKTHPPTHKQRCKTYFIPCTIKLQPKYQHLSKTLSPIINITHPNHQRTTLDYPHLSRYIHLNIQHPSFHILFAIITTISPILETCDRLLILIPNLDWTTILLDEMSILQNPPERHIHTTHPYTQFKQTNKPKYHQPPQYHTQKKSTNLFKPPKNHLIYIPW